MKEYLNEEQIQEIAEEFEHGDYGAITKAIEYGFKHDKLDYLLELNNKYAWEDNWPTTEILNEYLKLKVEIFEEAFKLIL